MLSVLLSGFGIGMLLLPASYPYYMGLLTQAHYGAGLIFAAKFLLAAPFCYHTLNGVRHLVSYILSAILGVTSCPPSGELHPVRHLVSYILSAIL
ncbi:Fumarate reductase/succinate dehydrogenase transmembrane subunit [Trinorchestia longiramus]|nr:Fumarate reductase/succinate dehydrogenase transmembrane subunit [Trinorchestia longiramus]